MKQLIKENLKTSILLGAFFVIIMPIYTFGHALNNKDFSNIPELPIIAIFAAVGYPFYWSWEIQNDTK